MEMHTRHIILENTVSLIRGRPPSVVVIVCLLIFILIFIFLCWKIIQLKWQLYEKQKYVEILDTYNKLLLQKMIPQDKHMVDNEEVSSFLFTAKARNEKKQEMIKQALQQSFERKRRGKARALVDELQRWQEDGYVERNYNAKVVYDELEELLTNIPVSYAGFRKYY